MKTRAEPDDDGYVVNGSKIWTSYAARADVMFLLARVGGKGKGGVSCFIVPMDKPGCEVRPTPGVNSRHDFPEIFVSVDGFTDNAGLGAGGENRTRAEWGEKLTVS